MSALPLRKLVMVPDRRDLRSDDEQFQAVSSAIPRLTRAPKRAEFPKLQQRHRTSAMPRLTRTPKPIHLQPPSRIGDLMTQTQLAVVESNELKMFEAGEPKKKMKNKWVSFAISRWIALLRITRSSRARPGGKPGAVRKRRESSPIVFISPGGFACILPGSETSLTLTQLDQSLDWTSARSSK